MDIFEREKKNMNGKNAHIHTKDRKTTKNNNKKWNNKSVEKSGEARLSEMFTLLRSKTHKKYELWK